MPNLLTKTAVSNPSLEKLRSELLGLPEQDRADLAYSLVASLDGPADPDSKAAWDAEIKRRLNEVEAGTARLIDREELKRQMNARLKRA